MLLCNQARVSVKRKPDYVNSFFERTENWTRATEALLRTRINQCQIRCGIKPLSHRHRIGHYHYFERWGYIRSENMAGARCSVWTSYHHVGMNDGLSFIERDIPAHPNHFPLTVDGNLLVHFAPGIEPPQPCSIHSSNSGEMRTRNLILLRKMQQPGKSLISLVEDDCILFSVLQGSAIEPASWELCP
jgi:hypothetical protein